MSGMQIKIPVLYNSYQVTRNSVIKKKKKCDKEKEQEKFPRNFCKEEINDTIPHLLKDIMVTGETERDNKGQQKKRKEAMQRSYKLSFSVLKGIEVWPFWLICKHNRTVWKFSCDSPCMQIAQGLDLLERAR